mmetsp:Transcript_18446/g.55648  ORF Transcript_18446/g.55648 Transcript_18446/m.55648 type:complete len:207 (+) Transcript_18446:783-1403(+)
MQHQSMVCNVLGSASGYSCAFPAQSHVRAAASGGDSCFTCRSLLHGGLQSLPVREAGRKAPQQPSPHRRCQTSIPKHVVLDKRGSFRESSRVTAHRFPPLLVPQVERQVAQRAAQLRWHGEGDAAIAVNQPWSAFGTTTAVRGSLFRFDRCDRGCCSCSGVAAGTGGLGRCTPCRPRGATGQCYPPAQRLLCQWERWRQRQHVDAS